MRCALLLAGLALSPVFSPASAQEPCGGRNGAIVEVKAGFPFGGYDEWLDARRRQHTFDEDDFRTLYPPERFDEYKDELRIPFTTYEEWLTALRARFRPTGFDETAFRRRYPRGEFQRYVESVEYLSIRYLSDGLEVAGHILRPRDAGEGRLPVVIYNRGGNRELGRLEFETLYSLFDLVLHGYVLVASQYRGCCGGEGHDEFGGADVRDVLNLLPLIDSLPYADPSRIGMYGWSRGGMMTYLALARTDRIAGAVIGAGPTDLLGALSWRREADALFAELIPGYGPRTEEQLTARSALYWPDQLYEGTPILLLQGGADRRNDPMDVLRMAEALYEIRHPFRLVFYEGGDHGLTQYEEEVRSQVVAWCDRYVRDRTPWPSLEPRGMR